MKYHLGWRAQRIVDKESGKTINFDILPNPSHLECVDPVVMGKTRAKQHFSNDLKRKENIAILVHGDAGFVGQGVVYESAHLSKLKNFTTGGVIHIITNNQIGFTADPKDTRNTPFCTDIGKSLQAPIIHVNADDPLAVSFAFNTAVEYWFRFGKDVIVDVIGYRRLGHYELDQPLFTQPLMYKRIAEKQNVLKIFEDRLVAEGVEKREAFDAMNKRVKSLLEEYYQEATKKKFESSSLDEYKPVQWQNFSAENYQEPQDTGIPLTRLKYLGEKITQIPTSFNAHKNIRKVYEHRAETLHSGTNIDWATAEALAFADLLDSGYTVRLTGEDVERGTFAHRHAIVHNQTDDTHFVPMAQCATRKENIQIHNSHLSEFAVLGFELGFSYYSPDALVLWEAQFGDFVNGAQTITDEFICSGESKWSTASGLVLLLPHGLDGQGPEHSSCKIERFLGLMDDDPRKIPDLSSEAVNRSMQIQNANMQICNPSFAANYFHLLRRQIKRNFRKPLVIASPKKLLRFKGAKSSIEEFTENLMFTKVRSETDPLISKNPQQVKRLLICSGQVYYDLLARRELLGRKVF